MPKVGKTSRQPKLVSGEQGYCRKCQKTMSLSNFYEATNPMIDSNSYMSICKDCCCQIYDTYFSIYNNLEKALYLTCQDLDVCFNYDVLRQTQSHIEGIITKGKTATKVFGYYKSKLGSTGKNNTGIDSFRFKNSDQFIDTTITIKINDENIKKDNLSIESIDNNFKVTSEIVKFWGKGYSPAEYEFLENEKPHWFERYKCDTRGEEVLYKQICYQLLDINKARDGGNKDKDISKMLDTLQKLMESANVKPKDANALSDSDIIDTYGTRIRDMELFDPAEYFEDKNLYRDFSGIEKYFKKWVVRPLKNLLKGTRDFEVGEDE